MLALAQNHPALAGFVIGMLLGGLFGFMACACVIVGSDADNKEERFREAVKEEREYWKARKDHRKVKK